MEDALRIGQEAVPSDIVLDIRNVSRVFRTRRGTDARALGNVTLQFGAGEFVALVGGSGCGKTTLLKMMGGLLPPSTGEILYRQKRVDGPVDDLGIVFQRPVLLEWLTVADNIALQLKMRRIGPRDERRKRAIEVLQRVDLAGHEDRYPWELSGGQQQRVSLCRALIHRPSLMLMDEPFGALDALTREQLQRDLERLWMERKPTVLFVTHDVGEAVTLADRVIVLAGRPGIVAEDIVIDEKRPRAAGLLENSALQAYARHVRARLAPELRSNR